MAIENIQEVIEYLENNKDNEDVVGLIKSYQQPLTRDTVEMWCKDGEGRSWLDRNCDIYATKAVNTAREKAIAKFKEEELPKIIDDAVKAKSNEGLTPEQLQLKELQAQLDAMKAEKEQAELLNANIGKLKDNGLDTSLAKYIKTDEDILFFKELIGNSVQAGIQAKLGDSNYKPPVTAGEVNSITKEQFNRMGYKERLDLFNTNKELYDELTK
ncbi:capsid assembly scaffolding protein Gp46 family protein [Clostridium butyricum]|uniref:capsid assembly scaffolding protein Gp46 family protein n=1 Tax=Clostridium butyricum TaxID=1492 RepID=UPI00325B639F